MGDIIYRKPVAYQDIMGKRQSVIAKYLLADNGQVSFRLGKYDTTQSLVIDPLLSYSSFLWEVLMEWHWTLRGTPTWSVPLPPQICQW